MAQTTEAACLLQSGAIYHRRLGLKAASGEVVFAGVKPGAVSVYLGDAPILHFDLDGRWQRAFIEKTHYLKGLDATVRSIDREREATGLVLRREKLSYAEAVDLDASIRSIALGLIDDLDSGRVEVLTPPPNARTFTTEEFREFLERVTAWDSAAWFAHVERFLANYGPFPLLPPDSPNPLVLQASLGDPGDLGFGGGPAAEHYVRSPDEFLEHARGVARLTGRRISQHRGVFLGGSDLLHRPMAELTPIFEAVARVFPIGDEPRPDGEGWDEEAPRLGSIQTFLEDFSAPLPDFEGWRKLRALHLGRVTLGVESGDPEILASLGKTWRGENLRRTVGDLKSAGVGVGLIVLVGSGGGPSSDRHVDATSALLASLGLEKGDLVILVDVRALGGWPDLTDEVSASQVQHFKERRTKSMKIVTYNPFKRWS